MTAARPDPVSPVTSRAGTSERNGARSSRGRTVRGHIAQAARCASIRNRPRKLPAAAGATSSSLIRLTNSLQVTARPTPIRTPP